MMLGAVGFFFSTAKLADCSFSPENSDLINLEPNV